jgi:glycosidase
MPGFDTESEAFSIIKTLGDLRKSSPAIQNGTYTELWVNDDILVFERRSGNDIVIVALNRGEATQLMLKI